jgi:hypothetical protein
MNRFCARGSQAIFALALLLGAVPAAGNTLPNGLQLAKFEISTANPAVVGSTVTVEMVLKNVSNQPLQFDGELGIFVAARCNSTSDANNRDFGHTKKALVLKPGTSVTVRVSTRLDAPGTWRFWPGFKLNGHWGPFRWMEETVDVFAGPAEARSAGEPIMVSTLLKNPAAYDQKRVTVIGLALIVRKNRDAQGHPWTLVSLSDIEDNKLVMNVFGPGHPAASNGDRVRVGGVFRRKSQRGRYTYDNEIQVEEGGIVVMRAAEELAKADTSHRAVIDLRDVVRKPFDLGRLRGNLKPLGAEIPLRFQARAYTNLPNPNTIVRTGTGSVAVKVLRAERQDKPIGPGSEPAGTGKTWLIVHMAVRGNPANFGDPENFYQTVLAYDLPPTFFLSDGAGEIYWPEISWETALLYRYKGYKALRSINTREPNWISTLAIFRIPKATAQPTLVALTWQGGNSFAYAGVRL